MYLVKLLVKLKIKTIYQKLLNKFHKIQVSKCSWWYFVVLRYVIN